MVAAFITSDKRGTNRLSDHILGRGPVFFRAAFYTAFQMVESPKKYSLFSGAFNPNLPLCWGLLSPGDFSIRKLVKHLLNSTYKTQGSLTMDKICLDTGECQPAAEGLWEQPPSQDMSPELLYYTVLQGFKFLWATDISLLSQHCFQQDTG